MASGFVMAFVTVHTNDVANNVWLAVPAKKAWMGWMDNACNANQPRFSHIIHLNLIDH